MQNISKVAGKLWTDFDEFWRDRALFKHQSMTISIQEFTVYLLNC